MLCTKLLFIFVSLKFVISEYIVNIENGQRLMEA